MKKNLFGYSTKDTDRMLTMLREENTHLNETLSALQKDMEQRLFEQEKKLAERVRAEYLLTLSGDANVVPEEGNAVSAEMDAKTLAELETLREENARMSTTISDMQKELASRVKSTENATDAEASEAIQRELTRLHKENLNQAHLIDTLNQQMDTLSGERRQAEEALKQQKAASDEEKTRMQKALDEKLETISALRNELSAREAEKQALIAEKQRAEMRLLESSALTASAGMTAQANAGEAVEAMKAEIEEKNQKVAALESELYAHAAEMQKLFADKAQADQKMTELSALLAAGEVSAQQQAEARSIRNMLDTLREEIAKKNEKVIALENERAAYEEEVKKLLSEKSQAGQAAGSKAAASEMSAQQAEARALLASLQAQIAMKDEKVASLESELKVRETELQNLIAEKTESEKQMADRLAKQQAENEQAMEALRAEIAEKTQKVAALENELSVHTAQMAKLTSEKAQADQRSMEQNLLYATNEEYARQQENARRAMDALRSEISQKNERVQALERELSAREAEMNKLATEKAAADRRVLEQTAMLAASEVDAQKQAEVHAVLESLQTEIAEKTEQVNSLSEEVAALEAEKDMLAEEKELADQKLIEQAQMFAANESEYMQKQDEILTSLGSMKTEVIRKSEVIAKLQKELSAREAEKFSLIAEKEDAQRKLTDTLAMIPPAGISAADQKRMDDLQAELANKEEIIESLRNELEIRKNEKNDFMNAQDDVKRRLISEATLLAEAAYAKQKEEMEEKLNALNAELEKQVNAVNTLKQKLEEKEIEKQRLIDEQEQAQQKLKEHAAALIEAAYEKRKDAEKKASEMRIEFEKQAQLLYSIQRELKDREAEKQSLLTELQQARQALNLIASVKAEERQYRPQQPSYQYQRPYNNGYSVHESEMDRMMSLIQSENKRVNDMFWSIQQRLDQQDANSRMQSSRRASDYYSRRDDDAQELLALRDAFDRQAMKLSQMRKALEEKEVASAPATAPARAQQEKPANEELDNIRSDIDGLLSMMHSENRRVNAMLSNNQKQNEQREADQEVLKQALGRIENYLSNQENDAQDGSLSSDVNTEMGQLLDYSDYLFQNLEAKRNAGASMDSDSRMGMKGYNAK